MLNSKSELYDGSDIAKRMAPRRGHVSASHCTGMLDRMLPNVTDSRRHAYIESLPYVFCPSHN